MLRVHSIFESISGEGGGFSQGTWMTGVRLHGCNLQCSYCDTPQAKNNGWYEERAVTDLLHSIRKAGNKHILITGGEPLLQPQIIELAEELLERNYEVQVETNGTLTIPCIPGVHWVVDCKCPSSVMAGKRYPDDAFIYQLRNLKRAGNGIYLKFVVADNMDVYFSISLIRKYINHGLDIPFIISPMDAKGEGITGIVDIIKEKDSDLLNHIIFSVQLHKIFDLP